MSAQQPPDPASIAALLEATERAHGEYEARELGGAYDEAWARWYAAYAVEHGIGELLEAQIGVDALETELTDGFAAFQAADPQPPSGWASFIAERLARR